jgi:hypothetical protein
MGENKKEQIWVNFEAGLMYKTSSSSTKPRLQDCVGKSVVINQCELDVVEIEGTYYVVLEHLNGINELEAIVSPMEQTLLVVDYMRDKKAFLTVQPMEQILDRLKTGEIVTCQDTGDYKMVVDYGKSYGFEIVAEKWKNFTGIQMFIKELGEEREEGLDV